MILPRVEKEGPPRGGGGCKAPPPSGTMESETLPGCAACSDIAPRSRAGLHLERGAHTRRGPQGKDLVVNPRDARHSEALWARPAPMPKPSDTTQLPPARQEGPGIRRKKSPPSSSGCYRGSARHTGRAPEACPCCASPRQSHSAAARDARSARGSCAAREGERPKQLCRALSQQLGAPAAMEWVLSRTDWADNSVRVSAPAPTRPLACLAAPS